MNLFAPRARLALLLTALVCGTSGCLLWNAWLVWPGAGDQPGARVLFDIRLPEEANAARLRIQVHDFEGICPPSQTNYHYDSFRGFVPSTDPPFEVELVAERKVWLNFVYYDDRQETKLLVGFELEDDGDYVALYANDGERFRFALSEGASGERVAVMQPADCDPGLWNRLRGVRSLTDE